MRAMRFCLWGVALTGIVAAAEGAQAGGPAAQPPDPGTVARRRAVDQLRSTHGAWDVTTEFLDPDGAVGRSVTGTYVFEWVIEDRVLRGESSMPALKTRSALLFAFDEAAGHRSWRRWVPTVTCG